MAEAGKRRRSAGSDAFAGFAAAMEALGEVSVRDLPPARLPGGFWAAVGVWLEKPQVANKRLCGARLEEARTLPRPGEEGGPRWRSAGFSALDAAWEALCCSGRRECRALGFLPDPGAPPRPLEVLLRTLVPKGSSPAAPAQELVVKGRWVGGWVGEREPTGWLAPALSRAGPPIEAN